MHRGLQFAITALLVTTIACGHGRSTAARPAPVQPEAAPVTVNVTNNSQSAMEIYVVGSGTTYHMGTVAPGIPRTFELRSTMIVAGGHIQFIAQATGAGPRVRTDEVIVAPGDVVDVEIATDLVGSRATVRP